MKHDSTKFWAKAKMLFAQARNIAPGKGCANIDHGDFLAWLNAPEQEDVRAEYVPIFAARAAAIDAAYNGRITLVAGQPLSPGKHQLARCECGVEFHALISTLKSGLAGCPECKKTRSNEERAICAFLQEHGATVETNVKIDGVEFDIVCREHSLAIEHHGLVWHAEAPDKRDDRHALKYVTAKAHGLRLLQIFSDEWENRRRAVELLILGALNKLPRIHARACVVSALEPKLAAEFLETHHVQASARAAAAYGLLHEGELVAAMQFARTYSRRGAGMDGVWELARFASSARVVGGASRLFSRFVHDHNPKGVLTYADHRYFSGAMYPELGFKQVGDARIDYEYVFKNKRYHKSSFQKARMREKFGDIFPADWTERQMAEHVGLRRIWNAGRTTFWYGVAEQIGADSSLPVLDEAAIRQAHADRALSAKEKNSAASLRMWADSEFRAQQSAKKRSPENVDRLRQLARDKSTGFWWHPDHGMRHAWHGDLMSEFGGHNSGWCNTRAGTATHTRGWRFVGDDESAAQLRAAELVAADENLKALADKKQADRIARKLAADESKAKRARSALARAARKAEAARKVADKKQKRQARALKKPSVEVGSRFGRLTVNAREEVRKYPGGGTAQMWRVRCDCGKEKTVNHGSLTRGVTRSCGCLHRESSVKNLANTPSARGEGSPTRLRLTGQRFGQLAVLRAGRVDGRSTYWVVRCDCGVEKEVKGALLTHGAVKSCGCLRKVAGKQNGASNRGRVFAARRERAAAAIIGSRFGQLTVTGMQYAGSRGRAIAMCDCGAVCAATPSDLRAGKQLSCGCRRRRQA